jgi:hypothetical protein
MEYDDDLLDTAEQARGVFSLLDTPGDYEIVLFRRDSFEPGPNTLGFDIGYWALHHYSIICDTAVMPRWHPPAADDLVALAEQLRPLNRNVLFDTVQAAETFLNWYRGRPWAEDELPNAGFFLTQVDEIPL